MKIKGTRTETSIVVDVPVLDVINNLRKKYLVGQKLPQDARLQDKTNHWYITYTQHTSHSWSEDKLLRDATPDEITVWEALHILDNTFKE